MKKKLLQVNITANWGSHGRIAEEIGKLAVSQGWESHLAYGRCANPSQSHLIHIGNMWDELWHGLQTRLFDNHGLASKSATRKLLNKIVEIHPDIIHLHNIHGYYLNYPLLFDFLSKVNIPVVWTLHDCWPMTGHCSFPSIFTCELWRNCCHDCPAKNEYPKSFLIDNSRKNYRLKKQYFCSVDSLHIVTVSKWLKNEVSASFLGEYDVKCIYNGIDIDVFRPLMSLEHLRSKHNISPNEKVVLGVASVWEERKGLDYFYQLRRMLSNEYRIILIGLKKGQTKYVPDGVDVVMRTNNQNQLAAYYSMADVFVNPSQAESFGLTTAEALACGTPCVAYSISASPELLDETTGLSVPLGDVNGLAEGIIKFCNDTNREERSKLCRQRAVALFNKNDRYQDYLDLYNSLLKQ